ncbi:RBR-type E3 ubiquitin transferase [Trichonephila clavipes]|nr:RBR-type E3 ubiquitin transferase [Trichonephila clavipes]
MPSSKILSSGKHQAEIKHIPFDKGLLLTQELLDNLGLIRNKWYSAALQLKRKAGLSLKRLDSVILNEKPEELTRKDKIEWLSKNSDAIAYIKLSLADEQALQFAAEDNAKVLWDKIRATYIGKGEDRKIDAGNELKDIRMKNGETVADYIARARGISTVTPLDWTCRRGNWSTIPLED